MNPHRAGSSRAAVLGAVAAGGAVGAAARYAVVMLVGAPIWPTLVVNLGGSFALGVVVALVTGRQQPNPLARPLLATGFLGAFTTYSTFAMDTILLLQQRQPWLAVAYMAVTITGGLGAVWAGGSLTKALQGRQ
jgi:CrcB protein